VLHFGERWYDPAVGRWTQQDPIDQTGDLKQGDRYTYVGGDPVNLVDPAGAAAYVIPPKCQANPSQRGCGGGPVPRGHAHPRFPGGTVSPSEAAGCTAASGVAAVVATGLLGKLGPLATGAFGAGCTLAAAGD
jgi:uncharacterized protein RhaS with RHS repeats